MVAYSRAKSAKAHLPKIKRKMISPSGIWAIEVSSQMKQWQMGFSLCRAHASLPYQSLKCPFGWCYNWYTFSGCSCRGLSESEKKIQQNISLSLFFIFKEMYVFKTAKLLSSLSFESNYSPRLMHCSAS